MNADFHVHTRFCDGGDTAADMAAAALALGLDALGFSGHAHTAFDESWCMSPAGTLAYRAEIARLRENYAGRLPILCGVEQDLYSDAPTAGYDYVIGSVHYLHRNGVYLPVDESAEALRRAAAEHFGGDIYALAEAYYQALSTVGERTGCGVVGHFDLIAKFNAGGALFDEGHPRCVAAWQAAADRLLQSGALFEVNTGAMARGYRDAAYPAPEIIAYLAARGGRFLLSGDAHSAAGLCFRFQETRSAAEALGAVFADFPPKPVETVEFA